jgi:hypothetical protein
MGEHEHMENTDWKTWKTWGDVPGYVQSHLLEGPFTKGVGLDSSMPIYKALQRIGSRGIDDLETVKTWDQSANKQLDDVNEKEPA